MDRPCTRANLNRPITNNALDTSCTKTTSTPRAGGQAKPGHAASGYDGAFHLGGNTPEALYENYLYHHNSLNILTV